MTRRINVTYGQPLEKHIGFARGARVGRHVAVSGTAPLAEDGSSFAPGDVAAQTRRCLEIITDVIRRAGGRPEDVVRTRIMLTDITRWQEAAEVHGAFFADIQPACTIMEVSRFIRPEWLVELEADAILPGDDA